MTTGTDSFVSPVAGATEPRCRAECRGPRLAEGGSLSLSVERCAAHQMALAQGGSRAAAASSEPRAADRRRPALPVDCKEGALSCGCRGGICVLMPVCVRARTHIHTHALTHSLTPSLLHTHTHTHAHLGECAWSGGPVERRVLSMLRTHLNQRRSASPPAESAEAAVAPAQDARAAAPSGPEADKGPAAGRGREPVLENRLEPGWGHERATARVGGEGNGMQQDSSRRNRATGAFTSARGARGGQRAGGARGGQVSGDTLLVSLSLPALSDFEDTCGAPQADVPDGLSIQEEISGDHCCSPAFPTSVL